MEDKQSSRYIHIPNAYMNASPKMSLSTKAGQFTSHRT